MRLLKMNSEEWLTMLMGSIACILNGAVYPLLAILLSKIIQVSVLPTKPIVFILQSPDSPWKVATTKKIVDISL